jgi:hypothetical protein
MLSAAITDSLIEKRIVPKTENKEKQSPHIQYGLKHHRPEYVPAYFVQNKDFCWIQTPPWFPQSGRQPPPTAHQPLPHNII